MIMAQAKLIAYSSSRQRGLNWCGLPSTVTSLSLLSTGRKRLAKSHQRPSS